MGRSKRKNRKRTKKKGGSSKSRKSSKSSKSRKSSKSSKSRKSSISSKSSYSEKEIPDAFKCPITLQIMVEPVVTSDGHTYEKIVIKKWLESHDTSPKTNQQIEKTLVPNYALRSAIEQLFGVEQTTQKNILDQTNANSLIEIFQDISRTAAIQVAKEQEKQARKDEDLKRRLDALAAA